MSRNSDDDIILQEMARERPVGSVFWAFFLLALACFIAKAHYLHGLYNFWESKRRFDWLQQLAAITQRDAAFFIIAGMASAVFLGITPPLNFLNRRLYRLIRLFSLLCPLFLILPPPPF